MLSLIVSLHLLALIEGGATVDHLTNPHVHAYLQKKLPDVALPLVAPPELSCSVAEELARAADEAHRAIMAVAQA